MGSPGAVALGWSSLPEFSVSLVRQRHSITSCFQPHRIHQACLHSHLKHAPLTSHSVQIHAWQLWIPALLCELGVHPGCESP